MDINPNRRRRLPPVTVHGTEPDPVRGSAGWGRDMVTAALMGAAIGAAAALALTAGLTSQPAPCETALAAADDMAYASAEVGRGVQEVADGGTVNLDALRDDWNAAFDAYEAARGDCEVR